MPIETLIKELEALKISGVETVAVLRPDNGFVMDSIAVDVDDDDEKRGFIII